MVGVRSNETIYFLHALKRFESILEVLQSDVSEIKDSIERIEVTANLQIEESDSDSGESYESCASSSIESVASAPF